jgi:hypothetical protein
MARGTKSVNVIGERRPQDHEDEDQPDMVGFPYRTNRTLDHAARMLTALGRAGGQVPEASPEVGPPEDRVRDYCQQ